MSSFEKVDRKLVDTRPADLCRSMFILGSGLEYAGILLKMRFASDKNRQVTVAAPGKKSQTKARIKWSSENIDRIMLLVIPPIFLVFTCVFWLVK